MAGLGHYGSMLCFLLTHILCFLLTHACQKARDTERSQQTWLPPPPPPRFLPSLPFVTQHFEGNPRFEDLCSAKETYSQACIPETLVSRANWFGSFGHQKLGKRHQTEEILSRSLSWIRPTAIWNGESLDIYQLVSGHNQFQNYSSWCPGMIN